MEIESKEIFQGTTYKQVYHSRHTFVKLYFYSIFCLAIECCCDLYRGILKMFIGKVIRLLFSLVSFNNFLKIIFI